MKDLKEYKEHEIKVLDVNVEDLTKRLELINKENEKLLKNENNLKEE